MKKLLLFFGFLAVCYAIACVILSACHGDNDWQN